MALHDECGERRHAENGNPQPATHASHDKHYVQRLAGWLPDDVRARPCFLTYRLEPHSKRPSKTRKVPFYADGAKRNGKADDRADLARLVDFETAAKAYETGRYDGIGIAIGVASGLAGIDLDGILDSDGDLVPEHPAYGLATSLVEAGALNEVTVSGTGLHFFGVAPAGHKLRSKAGVYEAYSGGRFFALTGQSFCDGDEADVPLDEVLADFDGVHTPAGVDSADEDEDDEGGDLSGIWKEKRIAEVPLALSFLDNADYKTWVDMGHILKSCSNYDFYEVWRDWSASNDYDDFDEDECQERWEGFKPDGRLGAETLFQRAKAAGWGSGTTAPDVKGAVAASRRLQAMLQLGQPDSYRSDEEEPVQDEVIDGFMPLGITTATGLWGAGKTTNFVPIFYKVAGLAPPEWESDGIEVSIRRKVVLITEAFHQTRQIRRGLFLAGAKGGDEEAEWFKVYRAEQMPLSKAIDAIQGFVEANSYETKEGFPIAPLIAIDTVFAFFAIKNENDGVEVATIMSKLRSGLNEVNPDHALFLMGHPAKSVTRMTPPHEISFRGSGAWEAAADFTTVLTAEQVPEGVSDLEAKRYWIGKKFRDQPTIREIAFTGLCNYQSLRDRWGRLRNRTYLTGVPAISSAAARSAERREAQRQREEVRSDERLERLWASAQEAIRLLESRQMIASVANVEATGLMLNIKGQPMSNKPTKQQLDRFALEGKLTRSEIMVGKVKTTVYSLAGGPE